LIEETIEKIKEAEEKRAELIAAAEREAEKIKNSFLKEREEYLKEVRKKVEQKEKKLREEMEKELAVILSEKKAEKKREREALAEKALKNRARAVKEVLQYLGFYNGSS